MKIVRAFVPVRIKRPTLGLMAFKSQLLTGGSEFS